MLGVAADHDLRAGRAGRLPRRNLRQKFLASRFIDTVEKHFVEAVFLGHGHRVPEPLLHGLELDRILVGTDMTRMPQMQRLAGETGLADERKHLAELFVVEDDRARPDERGIGNAVVDKHFEFVQTLLAAARGRRIVGDSAVPFYPRPDIEPHRVFTRGIVDSLGRLGQTERQHFQLDRQLRDLAAAPFERDFSAIPAGLRVSGNVDADHQLLVLFGPYRKRLQSLCVHDRHQAARHPFAPHDGFHRVDVDVVRSFFIGAFYEIAAGGVIRNDERIVVEQKFRHKHLLVGYRHEGRRGAFALIMHFHHLRGHRRGGDRTSHSERSALQVRELDRNVVIRRL